jgi:hypothetical protein
MVPTLSLSISDFTLADAGNLAGPTPECPRAYSRTGSLAAVTGLALCWAFPAQSTPNSIANGAVALARPGRG